MTPPATKTDALVMKVTITRDDTPELLAELMAIGDAKRRAARLRFLAAQMLAQGKRQERGATAARTGATVGDGGPAPDEAAARAGRPAAGPSVMSQVNWGDE